MGPTSPPSPRLPVTDTASSREPGWLPPVVQPRRLRRDHTNPYSAKAGVEAAIQVRDAPLGLHPDLPRPPAALHAKLVAVDVAGWFRRDEQGRTVFAVGECSGKCVAEVTRESRRLCASFWR